MGRGAAVHGVGVQETRLLCMGCVWGKGAVMHGVGVQETRLLCMGRVCVWGGTVMHGVGVQETASMGDVQETGLVCMGWLYSNWSCTGIGAVVHGAGKHETGLLYMGWMCVKWELFCFVCFVALRPKSTAMVMAGRPVHLTTIFPGQA